MSQLLTIENLFIAIVVLIFAAIAILAMFIKYASTVTARVKQSVKLINDLYQISQKHSVTLADMQSDLANNSKHNELQQDMSVLQHQLSQLTQELRVIENQTQQLEQHDPALKMYSKANKLVSQGASLTDIMEACDLPRAEAEVLVALHRKKQK